MKNDIAVHLEKFPLFQNCPKVDVKKYATFFKQSHFQKGECLFSDKEPFTKLYFVLSGKILFQKIEKNGEKFTIDILGPDDTFPITALIDTKNYFYQAKIIEPTSLLEIPNKCMEDILLSNRVVKINYIKFIQQKILLLNNTIEQHVNKEFS